MKITDTLVNKKGLSFEVFPPKEDQPIEPLYDTLENLYKFSPDFISCTYGAGGTSKGRNIDVLRHIRDSKKTIPLAHFTCIGNSREDIKKSIEEFKNEGIENLLALRGDMPSACYTTGGAFSYASELIEYINEISPGSFMLGGGCYPEKHIEAISFEADIDNLKKKQDAGAEFLTTQLCHDVNIVSDFIERIRSKGITIPVAAGVMPVLNKDAVVRMSLKTGCSIDALSDIINMYGDDPDSFREAGKEFTAKHITELYDKCDICCVHVYTLNRYKSVVDILNLCGIFHTK